MEEQKIIDMLTEGSVSIMTKTFVTVEGNRYEVGLPHRIAYVNSAKGRAELQKDQPQNIVSAVLAIWGEQATIEEEA